MASKSKKSVLYTFILFLTIGVVLACIVYYTMYFSRDKYIDNIETNEARCRIVSSRGILKSCDVRSSNPVSSIKSLRGIDISKIYDGCTVYVPGSAIPSFAKQLEEISCRFILVSGDCDETVPEAVLKGDEFDKFINSNKIIHWYSQNCTVKHLKLSQIPIGLDYHSVSDRGKKVSPVKEESELLELRSIMQQPYERKIACYSNFHLNMPSECMYCYDRKDAISKIPKELVYYENKRIVRRESWKTQLEYAFVISPHGNGLDCHRTWEALCLGCIPIIKTSGLDSLFSELPVLIVSDWGVVNMSLLEETVNKFKYRTFNYAKLELKYWMDIIRTGRAIK
jgi:hypothetical protein